MPYTRAVIEIVTDEPYEDAAGSLDYLNGVIRRLSPECRGRVIEFGVIPDTEAQEIIQDMSEPDV